MADQQVWGTVLGIDRDNGVVRALLDEGPQIEAAYDPRRMPWLFCRAVFIGGPSWRCWGPIGHRREVFHEDFTRVPTTSATGSVACDRNWSLTVAAGGTGSVAQATGGLGVARLTRTDTSGVETGIGLTLDSNSITIPTQPAGIQVSARFKVIDSTVSTGGVYQIGMSNTAYLVVGTSSGVMVPYLSGTATSPNERSALDVDTWYWADIAFVGSSLAGLWIDGNGPVVFDGSLANAPGSHTELYASASAVSATARLDVDCVTISAVSPVSALVEQQ